MSSFQYLTEPDRRMIGLDVGDRRIGIAVSDPTGWLASPVEVYQRSGTAADIKHVIDVAAQLEATRVVIGLPKNMNGTEGEQAEKTRDFAGEVERRGCPVTLWDERLSTIEATRRMEGRVSRRRRQPTRVDAEAAAIILQSYLDYLRNRKAP